MHYCASALLALTLTSLCRFDVLPSASDPDSPLIINPRHKAHLEWALKFLDAFLAARLVYDADRSVASTPVAGKVTGTTGFQGDLVCIAEELRYAAQAIGKISGRIDVEDVLDVIFRDFCIGK